MAAKKRVETKPVDPALNFLGVKWKKGKDDDDDAKYVHKRWVMDTFYCDGEWTAALHWAPTNPDFISQMELSGFGKTKKAALKDLEEQLSKVVGLMQP